jgi:hypothetical protein
MEGVLRRSFAIAGAALVASAILAVALRNAFAAQSRPPACAARAPIELPFNAWAPARRQLAPPGADAIRLCRYNALGHKPLRGLARSALIVRAERVRELVGELESLPRLPPGALACPMDNGALIDMLLAYRDGNGVLVQVDLTGCATVKNGNVTRTAGETKAGHALLAQIERSTGYKGPVF